MSVNKRVRSGRTQPAMATSPLPSSPPPFDFRSAVASPTDCPLTEPISLSIDFETRTPQSDVRWVVAFVVDMASSRDRVELKETGPTSYGVGPSSLSLPPMPLDLSGFPGSALLNIGLLTVTAVDKEGAELACLSFVTQVVKDGEILKRIFLDPLR